MIRIWFYFRETISTDTGRLRTLAKYAADVRGMELVGCTVEPAGRNMLRRPGVQEIIDAAQRQTFDVLLTPAIDHFSRSRSELESFLTVLQENGIVLRTETGVIQMPETV